MRTVEDECVDCGLPCIGSSCPNRKITRFYCDRCGEEFEPDELYDFDGEDFCKECLLEQLQTVEEREIK